MKHQSTTRDSSSIAPHVSVKRALRLTVVFTTPRGTRIALHHADLLARGLRARINLIATRVVPYHASLTRPPVALDFIRRSLAEIVSGHETPIRARAYLCRDPRPVFQKVIPPGSIVLLGTATRWWQWRERRLARLVQQLGHHVLLVPPQPRGRMVRTGVARPAKED
jgi:hypothetical protein